MVNSSYRDHRTDASPRLDARRDRSDLHGAAARSDLPRADGPPRASPRRRGAGLHAAQHQDRRLSRGLRLLPAVGALQDRRRRATDLVERSTSDARRPTRARDAGRHAVLHGRGLARRADGRGSSSACSRWSAACAGSGMEACCTLGMLTQEQADALAEAGLTAYNHNLDTSPEFYGQHHHDAHLRRPARRRSRACARPGITVCCGGIIGMGEDRPRPLPAAAAAGRARSASGERARQPAGARRRARRSAICRPRIRSSWCARSRRRAS